MAKRSARNYKSIIYYEHSNLCSLLHLHVLPHFMPEFSFKVQGHKIMLYDSSLVKSKIQLVVFDVPAITNIMRLYNSTIVNTLLQFGVHTPQNPLLPNTQPHPPTTSPKTAIIIRPFSTSLPYFIRAHAPCRNL